MTRRFRGVRGRGRVGGRGGEELEKRKRLINLRSQLIGTFGLTSYSEANQLKCIRLQSTVGQLRVECRGVNALHGSNANKLRGFTLEQTVWGSTSLMLISLVGSKDPFHTLTVPSDPPDTNRDPCALNSIVDLRHLCSHFKWSL